jgi:UDP-glucose 4-epimerase
VVRDFVFVDDVSTALEIAAVDSGDERIFNIGSGVGHSVRDVLRAIENSLRLKLNIIWKGERAVDVPISTLSIRRAQEMLGWSPKTSFESGIEQTISWWRDNAKIIKHAMSTPARMKTER